MLMVRWRDRQIKWKDNHVVIVASVTKFTNEIHFRWGYRYGYKGFTSEVFELDCDDFWMAKLRAVDEVIHKFDEPRLFFIRGVRFCASVYNPVNYKRKPGLDELCSKIRNRLIQTGSKLFPIMRSSEEWYFHIQNMEKVFDKLNPEGRQKVKEIDYVLKEKAGNGTNQWDKPKKIKGVPRIPKLRDFPSGRGR